MIRDAIHKLKILARGDSRVLAAWLAEEKAVPMIWLCAVTILIGSGCYGLGLGWPRAPMMGFFVSVKMSLLIFATLLANGLINGMLGMLLGSGMTFRQTLLACMLSFALFSLIVGSLSPLVLAMAMDAPATNAPGVSEWYRVFLLSNTGLIAFAGIIANHRLLGLIQSFSGSVRVGWQTLTAWLAGNLFVGAQLSYNLRPFFGNPELPVEFVRPDPFGGTFYEAVWSMLFS